MTTDEHMNAVRLAVIWFIVMLTIDAFYVGMVFMNGPVGLSSTDQYIANLFTGDSSFGKNLQIGNNTVNSKSTSSMYGTPSEGTTFLDKFEQTANTIASVTIIFGVIALGPLFFTSFLWNQIENPVLLILTTVFLVFCMLMFWIQVLKLIFKKGVTTND